eukprot:gene867-5702_t
MALPLQTQSDCSSDSNHNDDSQDSLNQSDTDIPHVHRDIPHVHRDIPHVHRDIPYVHRDVPHVDAHFGAPLVMDEIMYVALPVGELTGQVKWFNDRLGYGFCTVINDSVHKGRDIFVHHSGIRPLTSNYKTLRKGEYINFNVMNGHNGMQAVDVTGICGGPLMCDVVPVKTRVSESMYGSHHTASRKASSVKASSGKAVSGKAVSGKASAGKTVYGKTVGDQVGGGKAVGGKAVGGKAVGGKAVGGKVLSSSSSEELKQLRAEVKALKAREAKIIKSYKARVADMKKQVQKRFKELVAGTKQQLQQSNASPQQQSSIMDYLQAGLFTASGVIAAFAVVDLIAGAFGGGDNSGGNDDSPKENDAAADDAVADDEEDGCNKFDLFSVSHMFARDLYNCYPLLAALQMTLDTL